MGDAGREVAAGANVVHWNGVDRAGNPLPPDTYACSMQVNVGELHFIAQDLPRSRGAAIVSVRGDCLIAASC